MQSSELTEFEVRTRFGTLIGVQDQDVHFEEEGVWSDEEAAHFVETIIAHQQSDQSDASTNCINVMNNAIDGWEKKKVN